VDVVLVTCRVKPEPDPDEAPLCEALRAAGLEVGVLAWDDPDAEVARARAAVLRSTWNYPRHVEAFAAWVDRAAAATALYNGAAVVHANLHKGYLLRLERAGVPVAPTELVRRGAVANLSAVATARGWGEVVVKPAVSCASYLTERFAGADLARGAAHLAAILAERDALVQPYLASVESEGERALVWIDGAFTHAVRKQPRFVGQSEAVAQVRPLTTEERDLGQRALAATPGPLLYARVDVARDPAGRLVVMELELIEPSLFLVEWPAAMAKLVAAIRVRVLG
jgi:hypothetical protein